MKEPTLWVLIDLAGLVATEEAGVEYILDGVCGDFALGE
jgi:hypothetical protein